MGQLTAATDPSARQDRIACHHCGQLHRRYPLPKGAVAVCRACGLYLYEQKPDGLALGVALHLAAAVMWLITHTFPLITVEIQGVRVAATVFTGIRALVDGGLWPVAIGCALLTTVFPALRILVGLWALVAATNSRRSASARLAYRLVRVQAPWSMLEVYLLGLIVAYVKLMSYAAIGVGPATLTLFATILLIAWADTATDPEDVWSRIGRPFRPSVGVSAGILCHTCGLIADDSGRPCPRCGSDLHRRKTGSLQRTWALLITAMILYIPANLYPMMIVTSLGTEHPGTILGGVVDLIRLGDVPVAAVIFVASVLVPILKFLALLWLLWSVHAGSHRQLRRKTQMFAAVEWIGRWSMVDVFVVAILAGVVHVGGLFAIDAGVGSLAFGAVVVLTMLASMSFDPRLLWDSAGRADDRV